MRVLVGCEFTGRVRDAFIARGHDAISCDLLPTESPGPHLIGDVLEFLYDPGEDWDLAVIHPPCTYLARSGLHWNSRIPGRELKTEEALGFVTRIWEAPVERLCIENPVGCINTRLDFMPSPQYIQPYEFGDDASKQTGLWKRNLPDLVPTDYVEPRMIDGKQRWANQTDSGQTNTSSRWAKRRSETFPGIAQAMADQWGLLSA